MTHPFLQSNRIEYECGYNAWYLCVPDRCPLCGAGVAHE